MRRRRSSSRLVRPFGLLTPLRLLAGAVERSANLIVEPRAGDVFVCHSTDGIDGRAVRLVARPLLLEFVERLRQSTLLARKTPDGLGQRAQTVGTLVVEPDLAHHPRRVDG
jgi:hypothetical protein